MADLNVNTQEGGPRVLDFVYGAALGVSALFLSAGLLEVVKVAEFGQADLYGPGNRIKISDTVTASMGQSNTDTLHVQEFGQVDLYGPGAWVKVRDTVTASLGQSISASVGSESLKIADTVTTQATLLLASGFDETLYLEDGDLGYEQLHVQDTVISSGILVGPQITEQTIHVQDTVTASFDAIQAGPVESLKIADSVTTGTNLIQTSVAELVHIVDPVTTGRASARVLPLLYSSVTNRQVLWSSE